MLPDINILLALVFERHVHHARAKDWFESLQEAQCHVCRMTQQGFLRLATNPRVLQEDAVPLSEAWVVYDALLRDPRVRFAPEPPGLETHWRAYTQGQTFAPRTWNDAYLAAFARCASLTLVTFDRGFNRYADVACTVLSTD